MKRLTRAIQAALGTLVLVGCAAPTVLAPEIKPTLVLRDGGVRADDYYQLGRYYQAKERYEEAVLAYRKALQIDSALAEAHNALGAAYGARGRLDLAVAEFELAISKDPAAARYRNNLGYAYYLQGDNARAVAAFQSAIGKEPTNARFWNNLSLGLTGLGELEQAAQAGARASALARSGPEGPPRADAKNESFVANAARPVRPTDPVHDPAADTVPTVSPAGPASTIVALAAASGEMPEVAVRAAPAPGEPAPLHLSAESERIDLRRLDSAASMASVEMIEALARPLAASSQALAPLPEADAPLPMLEALSTSVSSFSEAGIRESVAADEMPAMVTLAEDGASDQVTTASLLPSTRAFDATLVAEMPLRAPWEDSSAPESAFAPAEAENDTPATPAGWRAGGSLVFEVPANPIIVAVSDNVLELKWSGTTLVARAAPPVEPGAAATSLRLEVSNGNGVTGAARKVDRLLRAAGLPGARLTNQKPYVQSTTEIQYRGGHEAAAQSLAARFPGSLSIARSDRLRGDVDVRLVVGKDLVALAALVEPGGPDGRLAWALRPRFPDANDEREARLAH